MQYSEIIEPTNTFVDVIIETPDRKIILVKRSISPFGWAFPGGYVDSGESLWDAACREAFEETSLKVSLKYKFRSFLLSRGITTVFIATADGIPTGADDALEAGAFSMWELPLLITDHLAIMNAYFELRRFQGV